MRPLNGAAGSGVRGSHRRRRARAKEAAVFDVTGYWVPLITEDWRFRMVTPPKGDYASVPLNPEGRRVADTWDVAKDDAAGNQCKAYGVGGISRQPGRVHFTWDNDNTLKMEYDAGTADAAPALRQDPASGREDMAGAFCR